MILSELTLSSNTFDLSELSQSISESSYPFLRFLREISFSPVTVPPWRNRISDRIKAFYSEVSLSEASVANPGTKEAAISKALYALCDCVGKFILQQGDSLDPTWRFSSAENHTELLRQVETHREWPDGDLYYEGLRLFVLPHSWEGEGEIRANPEDWGRSSIEISLSRRLIGPAQQELAEKIKPIDESLYHRWVLDQEDKEVVNQISKFGKRYGLYHTFTEYLLQARMFLVSEHGPFRESD
ncbi:MAG: hypothetical protein GF334_07045 [Candidatus Altiarchaeales archaeon]|nr:hypothetical protein [Candidatus Altiarchaeales archaeon]